ncbi:MAG: TlpA family protein disulfide reductase [Saprospiraceae bacterium]|nr:redoxin domain-containing protein [Saprospiraceae bacterium]MCB9345689.1 redoxin domain-containing protein [Lewinellaceae bacterium]
MKHYHLLIFFLCSFGTQLQSQDITFIDHQQISKWKSTESDTVFVINFWATWCQPCVEELPAFEELNRKYSKDKVQVILVNNDFKMNVQSKLIPFIQKRKLESQVVFMNDTNADQWIQLVSPDWSGGIPSTLIISRRKNKEILFEQPLTYTELESAILSVL